MVTYGDEEYPNYQEYFYLITRDGIEAYDTHNNRRRIAIESTIAAER